MIRDADATRQRLVSAARSEFAAYGQAGSRVDRIAVSAGANKAQIYHYFGSKEALFQAVWEDFLTRVIDGIQIDVRHVARYAVELATMYEEYPEFARLVAWQRLEGTDLPPMPISVASIENHIAEIASAQADGFISDDFQPDVVFALICHIAGLWADINPDVRWVVKAPPIQGRLDVVTKAAQFLVGNASIDPEGSSDSKERATVQ